MPHDDRRRARISRAAARRNRGATRSGATQVRRKRQREIQEARGILINVRINYKWFVVAMLWFVCFFHYADRQAIFSVFEPIKGEMGLSDKQLGVVGASFMWVYAAAAPLAGLVGDQFRRKTLILGGLIFWSLITVATAFSKNYTHLVICRALEGFG